jgi:hypothetical protein
MTGDLGGEVEMMAQLRVITSDQEKAESLCHKISKEGHSVEAGRMNESLRRKMLKSPPDSVIIDLERAPATGRDLGLYLRVQKATRHCLLVFLDGKPDKVGAIQKLLPDAIYTTFDTLVEDLKQGLANPPTAPLIPDSVFAGYAGRPLAAKLGIKSDMLIALLDAPGSIQKRLDPLPDRVILREDLKQRPDIALWFTRSERDLQEHLPAKLAKVLGGKLWILWPKRSSGVASDLTQQRVRQHGLDAGWVDFKVCSVDETWSGLCFTARKSK